VGSISGYPPPYLEPCPVGAFIESTTSICHKPPSLSVPPRFLFPQVSFGRTLDRVPFDWTRARCFVSCNDADGRAVEMRSAGRDDLDANLCLFLGNYAMYFGSLSRMTKGSTRMGSSNVTSSAASQCIGATEAKLGLVDVRDTVLEDSTTRAHNGGFCALLLESVSITRCLFARCRHTCDQQDAASASRPQQRVPLGRERLTIRPRGCRIWIWGSPENTSRDRKPSFPVPEATCSNVRPEDQK
jgi:hypothetical protein